MKITLRIWLTALIIQPILFCFVFLWAAIIIVPFEIAGSIPGILLFGIILEFLSKAGIPVTVKWVLLLMAALGLATLCSFGILLMVNGNQSTLVGDDYLFLIPAPTATLLALFIHYKTVHEYLQGNIETPLTLNQEP